MKIQLKRSNVLTAGFAKEPTASQLEYGELAINYNTDDPAIFLKDSNNNIIRISGVGNIADDGQVELPASTTPPSNPLSGNLWYNSDDGRLYIYYADADTEQWVDASPDSWDPTVLPDTTNSTSQAGTLDDRYLMLNSGNDPITGGLIVESGNVGIGTNNPHSALHVKGASDTTNLGATLLIDDSAAGAIDVGGSVAFRGNDGTNQRTYGLIRGGKESTVANNFRGYLSFQTRMTGQANTAEHMRIDSNGRVGIGTVSPYNKLTVVDTSASGIRSQSGSIQSTDANKALHVSNGDTTDTFNVSYKGQGYFAGNVGIGTDSPDGKLNISSGDIGLSPGADANELFLENTGSCGLTIGCGTNQTSNIYFAEQGVGVSRGAIVYDTNGDHMAFSTAGLVNERMRISSSGNVGIGTTSPVGKLDVNGTTFLSKPSNFWSTGSHFYSVGGMGSLGSQGSFAVDLTSNGYRNSSGTWTSLSSATNQTGASLIRLLPTGHIEFKADTTKASGTGVNPTLRIRLDGSGNCSFSTSGNINPVSSNGTGIALRSSGNFVTNTKNVNAPHQFRRNTNGDIIRFYNNSSTDCGAIRLSGQSTAYDTNSDYRLKENIISITDGIDRVKQLQPKRFNFIEYPEITIDGFIAHEAQSVVPEAISGQKDETEEQEYEVTPAVVDEEGNITEEAVMGTRTVPKYQRIDQSKLVPLLTAALQESIGRIETLEAEVAALKAQ